MFIGGAWVSAQSDETIPVTSPVDGMEYGRIARGKAYEVNLAVGAAHKALNGPWGKLSATERGRIMIRIADKVLERIDELSKLEAKDTGKPLSTARNDIIVLARYFEYYGGAVDKVHGQIIPFMNDYTVMLMREPHGVTGHIIPWNYPAQMLGRTLAPALAMGNATVLKPAEDTSMSALAIAAIAAEIGLPEGALNIVTGLGHEAGAALTSHPEVNFLTFTGSNEVGTLVQEAAARNAVKCVLELGGKSPQIVFEDADLNRALPVIIRAIVQNAGQTCTAGSRLLVQRSIYDDFIARVADAFRQTKVGTPEMDLDCGPLMNPAQLKRVTGYIEAAKADSIPLLAEGEIAGGVPSSGYYVRPALFGPVPRSNSLALEEVFGPVLAAFPFDDEADAVTLANGTDYGLLAAIWTESGARQQRVAKKVQAGQVFINCYGAGGGVELPFGGVKKSGHGREKGFLALEEMSTTKTLVQYHGTL